MTNEHTPFYKIPEQDKVFIEDGKKFLLWGSEHFVFPADIRELTVEEFVRLKCFDMSSRTKTAFRHLLMNDFWLSESDRYVPVYKIFDMSPTDVKRLPNCGYVTFHGVYEAVKLLAQIYGWLNYCDSKFLKSSTYAEIGRKTPPEKIIERAIKTLEKYGYSVVAPNGKAA